MSRPSRPWGVATVVAAAALALSACGETTDTTEPGGQTSAASPTDTATSPSPTDTGDGGQGDGKLVVGTLLPVTGDLAFLGPPEFAGVDLAIQDINKAGGVLGQDVTQEKADSGDGQPNIAPSETNKLLNAGADAIVGAASSSVSLSVIDKITGAGVLQISPANTSTAFDTYKDQGLYFRTAPSDVLQGAVMANLVAGDDFQNLAIMARQDSYGVALANQVEKVFTEAGGTVVAKELYAPEASTYSAEVSAIAGKDPDAIVLIAFEETKKIIPQMVANNIGPQDKQLYFVDGNTADYTDVFPPGTLEGVKGTIPGAELTSDFRERLLTVNPDLKDFAYGPEAYDATVLVALAAIAADDDAGKSIATQMQAVSGGGTKCTDFAECADMLANGEDIDYEGASGPIDFNETGSPSKATIGIYQYKKDNTFVGIDYVTGEI